MIRVGSEFGDVGGNRETTVIRFLASLHSAADSTPLVSEVINPMQGLFAGTYTFPHSNASVTAHGTHLSFAQAPGNMAASVYCTVDATNGVIFILGATVTARMQTRCVYFSHDPNIVYCCA